MDETEDTLIRVLRHKDTGLIMALCDDLPGFVVHAHSYDELEAKLGPAFQSFKRALGEPVGEVQVHRDVRTAAYDPPAFIAKAQLQAAA